MKCAHGNCVCTVQDETFCDATCRQAVTEENAAVAASGGGSVPLLDCVCGHPDCVTAQAPDLNA